MPLSRRGMLIGGGAAFSTLGLRTGVAWAQANALAGEREALKDLAARKGILFGTAVTAQSVLARDELTDLILHEAAMIVPENEMKWFEMSGGPDRLDFGVPDRMVAFAAANGLVFRGHCLLWHARVPFWFQKLPGGEVARASMLRRVSDMVSHYKGRVRSWDVLNEAVSATDGREDGLRKSVFVELVGPDYVDAAFHTAHEGDPEADLFYNDDGTEADTPEQDAKRATILRFLERLVHDDVPVDYFGLQGHLQVGRPFSDQKFRRFLKDVADLGLSIQITELDCADEQAPADPVTRDRMVAETYTRFLDVALDEPALDGVTTWGLSDRHSWLIGRDTNEAHVRSDDLDQRPLPFDTLLRPKRAWFAIADAFRTAPER